jgi:hypothetical protein
VSRTKKATYISFLESPGRKKQRIFPSGNVPDWLQARASGVPQVRNVGRNNHIIVLFVPQVRNVYFYLAHCVPAARRKDVTIIFLPTYWSCLASHLARR